jgi:hypothetical protein
MFLLPHVLNAPGTGGERTLNSKSLFGRCEVKVYQEGKAGKVTKIKPCSQVLLKIRKNGVDIRQAWVDGFDFDVGGLNPGSYDIEAYSETYNTHATFSSVATGVFMDIEILLTVKDAG